MARIFVLLERPRKNVGYLPYYFQQVRMCLNMDRQNIHPLYLLGPSCPIPRLISLQLRQSYKLFRPDPSNTAVTFSHQLEGGFESLHPGVFSDVG